MQHPFDLKSISTWTKYRTSIIQLAQKSPNNILENFERVAVESKQLMTIDWTWRKTLNFHHSTNAKPNCFLGWEHCVVRWIDFNAEKRFNSFVSWADLCGWSEWVCYPALSWLVLNSELRSSLSLNCSISWKKWRITYIYVDAQQSETSPIIREMMRFLRDLETIQ